jgi:RNA polymerase sigma factor (sigma-70 family)
VAGKMSAESPPGTGGSELSDIELVDRLIRGARGAFDDFYKRHHRLIFHCIRARADGADVNDVFQSFFERLVERDYRVLKLWQRSTSLPIYLSKVVRNFVIDFHRAKRKKEDSVGGLTELDFFGATENETITNKLILKELRKKGIQAWAKLDSRDRTIMCCKLHRDISNDDLAERLDLTPGALRTALSRAQVRLLAGLQTLAPEYFPAEV